MLINKNMLINTIITYSIHEQFSTNSFCIAAQHTVMEGTGSIACFSWYMNDTWVTLFYLPILSYPPLTLSTSPLCSFRFSSWITPFLPFTSLLCTLSSFFTYHAYSSHFTSVCSALLSSDRPLPNSRPVFPPYSCHVILIVFSGFFSETIFFLRNNLKKLLDISCLRSSDLSKCPYRV